MPDTQIDFKERLQILKENADSQRKIMFEKLIESKIANVGSNNKEEPILLNKVNVFLFWKIRVENNINFLMI